MSGFEASGPALQSSQPSHVETVLQTHLGGGSREVEGRCEGTCANQAGRMFGQQMKELTPIAVSNSLQHTEMSWLVKVNFVLKVKTLNSDT